MQKQIQNKGYFWNTPYYKKLILEHVKNYNFYYISVSK